MSQPRLARWLESVWYGSSRVAWLLWPLSWMFASVASLRRRAYRRGWLESQHLPVPVIVVGNITAGGTGKTPVVDWLVGFCRSAGYRPGIVSRGYGGRQQAEPRLVEAGDDAALVGDEPLLLRRRSGAPVCVHRDRVAAAHKLLEAGVDLIISDDGLQHYPLARDVEIAVLDGTRRLGNGHHLPAGPLREPASRLREVDLVLVNDGPPGPGEFAFSVHLDELYALAGPARCRLEDLRGQPVRALAGIGNPVRFLSALKSVGLDAQPVPVADHGRVDLAALFREGTDPIVMTEKDAVKYASPGLPTPGCAVWVAPLSIEMPEAVGQVLLRRLAAVNGVSRK